MAALVLYVIDGILNFLITLLPLSPVTEIATSELMQEGLGWLNWFVNIDGIIRLLGALLFAGILYSAVRMIRNHIDEFLAGVIG